jgi:hypothetical protein
VFTPSEAPTASMSIQAETAEIVRLYVAAKPPQRKTVKSILLRFEQINAGKKSP